MTSDSAFEVALADATTHTLAKELFRLCIDCWAQFAVTGDDGTRVDGGLSALEDLREVLETYCLIDAWGRIVGEDDFGQPPKERRQR